MTRYLTLALLLIAAPAFAQTVPGPRVTIALEQPQASSCENPQQLNAWNFTYGSCYRPAGVNMGDPFVTHVRVTFTGATTISTLVPRGQVSLETTAARCGGVINGGSCLRIADLPAPVGAFQITTRFVDGEGREGGASNSIPFSGTAPAVPTAQGLRLGQ